MNRDEFFTALTACKNDFTWEVNEFGEIRGRYLVSDFGERRFCPITAIALNDGFFFDLSEYQEAAMKCGICLPDEDGSYMVGTDAGLLALAADSHDIGLGSVSTIRTVRAQILQCLALEGATHEEQ